MSANFYIQMGKGWNIYFTNDENILEYKNSVFGFGFIYIRKTLSLRQKNQIILEELAKGTILETEYFEYIKLLLSDDILDYAKKLGTLIGQIILDKNISSLLKT